jgi:hypothetical protein
MRITRKEYKVAHSGQEYRRDRAEIGQRPVQRRAKEFYTSLKRISAQEK